MDDCPLLIEVCELVIDCTSYGRPRIHYLSHLDDLRACALTCRSWLPRSRLNLYRCVWLQERCQLERFSQTIADHPFLGKFVQELFLGDPRGGGCCAGWYPRLVGHRLQMLAIRRASEKEPMKDVDWYIPFANDTLVRALQNVRVLTIRRFDWHTLHYRYHETAARYSIVELNIIGDCFKTFPDLLRVVWAFRHLRTLRLIDVKFERVSSTNLKSIAQKRPRLCHELIDLHVVGDFLVPGTSFIPCGCFGTNIMSLTMSWTDISWAEELVWAHWQASPQRRETIQINHHIPYLRFLPHLQKLTWRVVKGRGPWTSEDLHYFSLYVSTILETGLHEESTLARVTLQFDPRSARANMTRTRFIEAVLFPHVIDVFGRLQRVRRLQLLQLIVPERRWSKHDESWWREQVNLCMPHTKVAARIDTFATGNMEVWMDEPFSPDEMCLQESKSFSLGGMFGELTTSHDSEQPILENMEPTTDIRLAQVTYGSAKSPPRARTKTFAAESSMVGAISDSGGSSSAWAPDDGIVYESLFAPGVAAKLEGYNFVEDLYRDGERCFD